MCYICNICICKYGQKECVMKMSKKIFVLLGIVLIISCQTVGVGLSGDKIPILRFSRNSDISKNLKEMGFYDTSNSKKFARLELGSIQDYQKRLEKLYIPAGIVLPKNEFLYSAVQEDSIVTMNVFKNNENIAFNDSEILCNFLMVSELDSSPANFKELILEIYEPGFFFGLFPTTYLQVRLFEITSGEVATKITIEEGFYQELISQGRIDVEKFVFSLKNSDADDFNNIIEAYKVREAEKQQLAEAQAAEAERLAEEKRKNTFGNFLYRQPYEYSFEMLGLAGDNWQAKTLEFIDELYDQSSTVVEYFTPEYKKENNWDYKLGSNVKKYSAMIYGPEFFGTGYITVRVKIITTLDNQLVYFEQEFDKPQDISDLDLPESRDNVLVSTSTRGSKVSHVYYIRKPFVRQIIGE